MLYRYFSNIKQTQLKEITEFKYLDISCHYIIKKLRNKDIKLI